MPEELPASELDAPSIDFLLRSQRLIGIKRTLAVQKVCVSCDTEGGFQLKCGTCLVTYYCNADYQKTHWKKHKVSSRPPVPVVSSKYALALPDYAFPDMHVSPITPDDEPMTDSGACRSDVVAVRY